MEPKSAKRLETAQTASTWASLVNPKTLQKIDLPTKWLLLLLTLFTIFNFRNIFQQTAFYHPLPPVNLIKVLNNGDRFLNSTKTYFQSDYSHIKHESMNLYSSLSSIYELNKKAYLENYKEWALVLRPSFLLDESEISVKFFPSKYYLKNKEFSVRNGTVSILEYKYIFDQQSSNDRDLHDYPFPLFLQLDDHHKQAEDFLHKFIYPLYEASNYPKHTYNLDPLLDFSFVLKYLNFGIFTCSLVYLTEALVVSVSNAILGDKVFSNSNLNYTICLVSLLFYAINFFLISTNIILSLVLVGQHLNEFGISSTLLNFAQLFCLITIGILSKSWFKKVYLQRKTERELEDQYNADEAFDQEENVDGAYGLRPMSVSSIKRHIPFTASTHQTAKSHKTDSGTAINSTLGVDGDSELRTNTGTQTESGASSGKTLQPSIHQLLNSNPFENIEVISKSTESSSANTNVTADKRKILSNTDQLAKITEFEKKFNYENGQDKSTTTSSNDETESDKSTREVTQSTVTGSNTFDDDDHTEPGLVRGVFTEEANVNPFEVELSESSERESEGFVAAASEKDQKQELGTFENDQQPESLHIEDVGHAASDLKSGALD